MPVNKVRRNGSYAPLSAHAYKDDALASAGEAAELLYYRGLSFCADVLSDGFVSDTQLTRFVGVGMRDAKKRASRLVEVGLWIREEDGYRCKSWLKWNRSRDEINGLARKDAERKGSDRDSVPNGIQTESERKEDGFQSESELDGDEAPNGFQPRARTPLHDTPRHSSSSEADASGAPKRRRPKRRLPENWEPNPKHREYAASNDLDIAHEAEQFRSHATANDRQQADWDAAFRTWLGNNVKWDRPRAVPASETSAAERFQLPAAPKEIIDDPDPTVYVRWAKAKRDAWLAERSPA